jgi:hypothetical protein
MIVILAAGSGDCLAGGDAGHSRVTGLGVAAQTQTVSTRVDQARQLVKKEGRSAGATDAAFPAFLGAPFFLGYPAPDSSVPAELVGPCQTGLQDLAGTTDDLGFFYLEKGRAGVPDGEEELGVLV